MPTTAKTLFITAPKVERAPASTATPILDLSISVSTLVSVIPNFSSSALASFVAPDVPIKLEL